MGIYGVLLRVKEVKEMGTIRITVESAIDSSERLKEKAKNLALWFCEHGDEENYKINIEEAQAANSG